MIEDAVIFVNGEPFLTRLHEHGKEDRLYGGYIEGTETILTSLKNTNSNQLEIFQNGKLEVTLIGVVYEEIVNMYDHFILHMDWANQV
jgi:hypothetical protein